MATLNIDDFYEWFPQPVGNDIIGWWDITPAKATTLRIWTSGRLEAGRQLAEAHVIKEIIHIWSWPRPPARHRMLTYHRSR